MTNHTPLSTRIAAVRETFARYGLQGFVHPCLAHGMRLTNREQKLIHGLWYGRRVAISSDRVLVEKLEAVAERVELANSSQQ